MDPIADLLTIIRNGYLAHLSQVDASYSQSKEELAKVLFKAGFIEEPKVVGKTPPTRRIVFGLKYKKKEPVVTGIKRVSKPGARIYSRVDKIPRVRFGFGVTVVSTSKGLMTDRQARQKNLGGEVICQVW